MGTVLFWLSLGFAWLRWLVATINLVWYPGLPAAPESGITPVPRVSLLIPARNEARNIGRSLEYAASCGFPFEEICVYDDCSEDDTAGQVIRFSRCRGAELPVRLLRGEGPPAGWLGKPHACHRLAEAARGEVLLFIDAEVCLHPGAVEAALELMRCKQAALVSFFPRQQMESFGERLIVPVMHWLLVSLLPIRLVEASRWAVFSAANGQFMCFDGEHYRRHRWHAQVRNLVVEDIGIMRKLKRGGHRGVLRLADQRVCCRMYQGLGPAFEGFSKNILAGFGDSVPALLLFWSLVALAWLTFPIPLLLEHAFWLLLPILGIRWQTNLLSGQPDRRLWMHPVQVVLWLVISLNSIRRKWLRKNNWKGRPI